MSIQDRFGSKGTPPHGIQRIGSLVFLAVIPIVLLLRPTGPVTGR